MNGNDPNPTTYLDYVARCRQAFTPFAPIELPDFFAGREHVIDDIEGELQAPGRQVAIYGERGVGKTSLAVLLYFFAGYDEENVHIFRCLDDTTFEDICLHLLLSAGQLMSADGAQVEAAKSGEGRLGPISGGLSRRSTVTYRSMRDSQSITISRMLDTFAKERRLLIIDEFDRVKDNRTKTRMAEMVKHFSDARCETKIVLVGVAETLNDLIGEHESLSRSLAQIGLKRMHEQELEDIIKRGSQRIGCQYDPSVIRRVVCLSDGFPHFVHLICLYAALCAGERLRERDIAQSPVVGDHEYALGVRNAIAKSEHSLQEAFEVAVITTRRKSDIYELTLRAAALSDERDVQVQKLAAHGSYLMGEELRAEKFSNALGGLIKADRGKILTKVRDGYYKFTNPLMRPYIRLLLELDNITQHGGQLEFPFMKGV